MKNIKKNEEVFKVRYSPDGLTCRCVEKYNDIWFNYKDAKKEFDKLAHPKVINKDTVHWVELSYFPEDADDELIVEDWELSDQEKWLVKLAKALAQKGVNQMGSKYTDAQKNASLKYQKKLTQIKITLHPLEAQIWKDYCTDKNITMTELIRSAVHQYLHSEH